MSEVGIYTSIAITLLGIAYPILLQVIATLDEKYSSVAIIKLFDTEWVKKGFVPCLALSIFFLIVWTFKIPAPNLASNQLQYLLANSGAFLMVSSSIVLVGWFFLLVDKVFIYLTPIKFVNYLIRCHKTNRNPELPYFNALADVFIHSVQKQDHPLSLTIARFFQDEFISFREKNSDKPIVYPDAYYDLVYKTIEELAILKDKRNIALEHQTAGSRWLLGGMEGYEISERTYAELWHNIKLAIQYDRDDLVMYHWQTAHQYMTFSLRSISPKWDKGHKVLNEIEVEKRKKEREIFLNFHYALGGLLLYRKKYQVITRMFDFTQSEPPSYELLPSAMSQIFEAYMKFRDPFGTTWISQKYPFPDMEGVKSDALIGRWVSSYLALLMLRQYIIRPHPIDPLTYPAAPKSQSEKRSLINALEFFKRLVSEHLENTEVMEQVKLKFITPQWSLESKKVYPLDFIEQFRIKLEEEYKLMAVNLEISQKKKLKFYTASKTILEKTFSIFKKVSNTKIPEGETTKWFAHGSRMVEGKDSFAEQSEVDHANYDTFLASHISDDVVTEISYSFIIAKTKSYLLKAEDLFPAIDKMGLTKDHVIIAFGMNLSDYVSSQKIPGLTETSYKGIEILEIPNSRAIQNECLFVLKRNDLPSIEVQPAHETEISRYNLEKIGDAYPIYASVLDLNKVRHDILSENAQTKTEEELRKSVLMILFFTVKIEWKKGAHVYQLNQYSEYWAQGIPNKLDAMEPVK